MRLVFDYLRTLVTIAMLAGAIVVAISLARAPRLPAIEAGRQVVVAETRMPRLVAKAETTIGRGDGEDSEAAERALIGPAEGARVRGGSVLSDLLSL